MTWQSKLFVGLATFAAGVSRTDVNFAATLGFMLLIALSSFLMLTLIASRKQWTLSDEYSRS